MNKHIKSLSVYYKLVNNNVSAIHLDSYASSYTISHDLNRALFVYSDDKGTK